MNHARFDGYADIIDLAPELGLQLAEKHDENVARLFRALRDEASVIFQPKPTTRPDQLADAHRVIPSAASADPGPYSVSTYEVARSMMNMAVEPGVSMGAIMAPIQLCKTNVIECLALHYGVTDPAPVLVLEPNDTLVTDLSKTKIDNMINFTEIFRDRIYKNTIYRKSYKGGYLAIKSGATKNSVISVAARVTMADEAEEIPEWILDKLINRSESFRESFNLFVCSPSTVSGFIFKMYMRGDQRQPFIVCPKCSHDHVMKMFPDRQFGEKINHKEERKCLVWNDDGHGNWDLKSARYMCANQECNHVFSEGQRLNAIGNLRWRQTKKFYHCDMQNKQDPVENNLWESLIWNDGIHHVDYALCKHCGQRGVSNYLATYWTNRLYTPKPLDKFLKKWKDATKRPSEMRVFVVDHLAEPFLEVAALEYSAGGLKAREETYPQPVPDRVVLITVGVDRQGDRFELEFVGHGLRGETWSLDYQIILGNPDEPEIYRDLDLQLNREFVGKDGRIFRVSATCVDTGGAQNTKQTRMVYNYCHERHRFNVWAIKGASEKGSKIELPWPKTPTYVNQKTKAALHVIGTTALKNQFFANLARSVPGPGFVHFPVDRPDTWYTGLVSEKQEMKDGVLRWVDKYEGVRNEPLDCRIYAMAALEGLKSKYSEYVVEKTAAQMGVTAQFTQGEIERFSLKLDEIARETQKSLDQGRAVPIKKPQSKPKFTPKAASHAKEPEQVADLRALPVESATSPQIRPRQPGSGKMKAPFRLR